jgi:hypothetical protein
LITVRAVFAHLLSPEIIGNMLNQLPADYPKW